MLHIALKPRRIVAFILRAYACFGMKLPSSLKSLHGYTNLLKRPAKKQLKDEELSLALFSFTYAAILCLTYSWETLMPCQYAATACCAAAVIFGVFLPLLSLRLMLLRILLMMGMLECRLCFPEESSLRGCAASPASMQILFSSRTGPMLTYIKPPYDWQYHPLLSKSWHGSLCRQARMLSAEGSHPPSGPHTLAISSRHAR